MTAAAQRRDAVSAACRTPSIDFLHRHLSNSGYETSWNSPLLQLHTRLCLKHVRFAGFVIQAVHVNAQETHQGPPSGICRCCRSEQYIYLHRLFCLIHALQIRKANRACFLQCSQPLISISIKITFACLCSATGVFSSIHQSRSGDDVCCSAVLAHFTAPASS